MNTKAYLILFLFLIWSIGSSWYYVCTIKKKCLTNKESKSKQVPFSFQYNSDIPEVNANVDEYKEQLLAKLGATNKLKIVGNYDLDEQNTTSFENLGIARAVSIRNLFSELDDSRFLLLGKASDFPANSTLTNGAQLSIIFQNEYVSQTETGAVIHFLEGSDKGELAPEIHEYLEAMVAEHKVSDIEIIGHTDNQGKDGENFSLAMARAISIKDELIAKGMPVEKLTAMSKGETEPIEDNATAEGRSRNRRVEIIINE